MKKQRPKQFSLFGQADKGILLFVVDNAELFLSHRLPIALTALNSGYEVHVAAPQNFAAEQLIESYSIVFHRLSMNPEKFGFFSELKTFFSLRRIIKEVKPDLLHLITLKPTLYGSVIARMNKVPAVVATITGTRKIRLAPGSEKENLRQKYIRLLYGYGFKHPNLRVTFQNKDDRDMFLDMALINKRQIALIRGTGVNMQQFHPMQEIIGTLPLVLLASRMRWDKGVGEFVAAAKQLQESGTKARFVLVGGTDPTHPEAIPETRLQDWHNSGIIEWWGPKHDMPIVFAQAHIVCLPSYREGLPKVLVEAAACGKPIVATDVSGCREIIVNEENGLLVPVQEVENLAVALNRLLSNPHLRFEMGQRGRQKVVAEFSIGHVVDKTLGVYESLLQI
ncbi:glycosyltransferase family 4 protein [Oxalobacter vibrioformis]|uniref:Glycosyltransferase family 4 protein n=1 Tax=Oxalobacter vibrioformis TaxID=933080 RepID=A0A9E9LX44_9BURK|nr:glycosyltransferase family 4 protein [Oxalobacter vibrioformis]WAW09112.1 glycosyltransferase family 4 protein [Oxalobacter vibrioformis]